MSDRFRGYLVSGAASVAAFYARGVPSRPLVVCHVVRPAGRSFEALQLLRSPGRYMAGSWQAVSGKLEPGETRWRAVLRELAEETGLRPTELYNLIVADFYVPSADEVWRATHFAAVVEPGSAVRLNDEHDAARWVPLAELEEKLTWPADKAAWAVIRRDVLRPGLPRENLRIELPADR